MNKILVGFFLLALLSTGCKYKLGHPEKLEGKKVYLEVKNRTFAPQIGPLLNRVIREELTKTGELELVLRQSEAEYSVDVVLVDYQKSAEFFNPMDTLLASGFQLGIKAEVEMRSMKNKKNTAKFSVFSESRVVRESANQLPRDRQALMNLTRTLGEKIAFRVRN